MNKPIHFVSLFFYNQQDNLKANMKCRMSEMRCSLFSEHNKIRSDCGVGYRCCVYRDVTEGRPHVRPEAHMDREAARQGFPGVSTVGVRIK